MCNRFQFENKSVAVTLINDGLMSTIESFMRMNGLLDREQVSWLVSMNDAFVRMNDAFVRMSDALVRMNESFVRTKRASRTRFFRKLWGLCPSKMPGLKAFHKPYYSPA